jgi:GlcNAc-PI de-N-acetylase
MIIVARGVARRGRSMRQTWGMASDLTLMAVHAHPDDEASSTGGVLATYGEQGIRTVVVTCTNGEFGDAPGGVKLSTGVFVLYADEESFTLMTPQGHMFAGWITFSAPRSGPDTLAQAQVLMRGNDPLYEIGLALGGHGKEDRFWAQTLTALGERLGVADPQVETRSECIDPRRQWRNARNIWHNAAVRSMFQAAAAPFTAKSRRPASGQ